MIQIDPIIHRPTHPAVWEHTRMPTCAALSLCVRACNKVDDYLTVCMQNKQILSWPLTDTSLWTDFNTTF